jgi:hypothetical protein
MSEKKLVAAWIAASNAWYELPTFSNARECNRVASLLCEISDDYNHWLDESDDMLNNVDDFFKTISD